MDLSANQIVSKVLISFKVAPSKFIIDIGASEGKYNSCSFHLLNELDWSGILIEPMPLQFKQLQESYKNKSNVQCIHAALTDHDGHGDIHLHPNDGDGSVTANHGSSLLKPNGSRISFLVPTISFQTLSKIAPLDIGLLTIDTEGYDLIILQNLMNLNMRPQSIISENFFETKDEEKHALLDKCGYRVVIDNGNDTGWILKDK